MSIIRLRHLVTSGHLGESFLTDELALATLKIIVFGFFANSISRTTASFEKSILLKALCMMFF